LTLGLCRVLFAAFLLLGFVRLTGREMPKKIGIWGAFLVIGDESLTKNRLTGVLFGWMGVAILIGIDALSGVGMKIAGQAAVLGASFLYAMAAIFGRRFKAFDPVVWAALFGLSAVSTALAYIIYFYVLSKAGATNILLVTFLIPVSAIFLGMMVLGETPGWNVFAGMALIFMGLVFIDGRLLKRFKS